ncbi:DUF881 domain-containing protein [Isoptericola sp. NPDC056605]|uniref:DUF881 domain-containing protein n=1 Tax=Isoptericola sp. NPDC056605 TaxID=3345876 RepID=UPI00367B620C
MSDPKGDRPDTPESAETPETPDVVSGEGDEDMTAGAASSAVEDDAAVAAASAGPPQAPAPQEDQASQEEPVPPEAPSHGVPADGDSIDRDLTGEDSPQGEAATSLEPEVDEGEAVGHAEPAATTEATRAGDSDDELEPPGEPLAVEPAPAPAPAPGPPDDAPGDSEDSVDSAGTDDPPESDAPEPGSGEPAGAENGVDDTTEHATASAGAASAAPSGWRRLGAALRPRASRSQVLAGVLCAALGFALVVQVQQSASDQLSSARQEDLVRLLDEVTDRAQQLGDEVSGLEATRDELESGSGQARSALELAEQRAESEGILSGRLPAQGPGVRVTIQDPAGALKASQMFNVLEELRNAGAEVVELNGVRLVTSTWFEDEGGAIVVDGTSLSSPYEWTVIGDPETMDRALEIPGGALATVRTAGAEASTAREDEVKITAVTPPGEPEYAQPERARD